MTVRGEVQAWLEKALAAETDDCLIWPFSVASHGYGDFRKGGTHWCAHTYVCTVAHRDKPSPDMDAAHSCGVRKCANKRHLSWKTRAQNAADKAGHGTLLFGERGPSARLRQEQVAAVRASQAKGVTLARALNVHPNTIYAVRQRRSWRHVQ